MQSDLEIGIAKRLDKADLFALGLHKARNNYVKQESGHSEEYRRHNNRGRGKPGNLFGNKAVRHAILALIGPLPPVAVQEVIRLRKNIMRICPALKRDQDFVNRTFHIKSSRKRLFMHPKNGKSGIVGNKFPRCRGKEKFRRGGKAYDLKTAAAPLHRRHQGIAKRKLMSAGKAFKHHDLIHMTRRKETPLLEVNMVEPRRHGRRQRQGRRPHRKRLPRHIEQSRPANTPLSGTNPLEGRNPIHNPGRRARHRGKDIGETIAFVILHPRFAQGLQHPRHHDQKAYPYGHDEGNRRRLPPYPPEIAH